MVKKYQLRPMYVQAVKITNGNWDEVIEFLGGIEGVEKDAGGWYETEKFRIKERWFNYGWDIFIKSPYMMEGVPAVEGDWIVKDEYGDYHVYDDNEFTKSFTEVAE